MIVAGGTYAETVDIPHFGPSQGGSGFRGATAVGSRCDLLITATADGEFVGNPSVKLLDRSESVNFSYFTPLSTPRIVGVNSKILEPVVIDEENALVFGMVEECEMVVRARRLVIDPQSPRGDSRSRLRISADEQVLSANAGEIARMADSPRDLHSNIKSIWERGEYVAVVLRAGALGCLVADKNGIHSVPPHPTASVWTLGSGDVFSSAFATAWFEGADPVEAANVASNATAWWCGTRRSTIPECILNGSATVEDVLPISANTVVDVRYHPAIYLAGPFFTIAERWLIELVFRGLQGLGARPFSPLHHVGLGGDDVAQKDIDGLENCDAILALLDHYDAGTLFETGWASARQIPVVAYRSHHNSEGDKMLVGFGAEIHTDLTTALYRSVWVALGAELTAKGY